MIKKFLLIALSLSTMSGFAGIKVQMTGFQSDTVTVTKYDLTCSKILSKNVVVAKKGAFEISSISEPMTITFTPAGQKNNAIAVVDVNDNIEMAMVKMPYGINQAAHGSETMQTISKMISLQNKYVSELQAYHKKDQQKFDSVMVLYRNLFPDYIKANLDAPVSIWLMSRIDVAEAETLIDKVGENAKKSFLAPYLTYINDNIIKMHEKEAAEKATSEGNLAPDFVLPDNNGNNFSLSSLRGKWVIIDFWGTWCPWCIKGIPQMKENYAQYKDKLEIISIACRDTKDKWLKGIEKYGLNWVNVISLDNAIGSDKRVEQIYAVSGYPTKFLVNPEGIIVKKCVGEDPSFYDDFSSLIK